MSLAEQIARENHEPQWVADIRKRAESFIDRAPYPKNTFYVNVHDYLPHSKPKFEIPKISDLENLPEDIRKMLLKLGIPEHEWKRVLGMVQVDEQTTSSNYLDVFRKQGADVLKMSDALAKYEWLQAYAFRLMPVETNQIAAFHTAYWNGGAFIHIHEGAHVTAPIHTYFLITEDRLAQADHTVLIAEPGSEATFIEGCTAPPLLQFAGHFGATEVYIKKGAKITEVVLQNWPGYVHTRPITRMILEEGAEVHLLTILLGTGASTGRDEEIVIRGKGGKAVIESVGFVKDGERITDNIRILMDAPEASGLINTKSVARERATSISYTDIRASKNAKGSRGHIECAGLLLTPGGVHETWPTLASETNEVHLDHEAFVGRISEEILFYLKTRGLSEEEAVSMIVQGYIQPILKHVPIEYALEIRKIADMVAKGES